VRWGAVAVLFTVLAVVLLSVALTRARGGGAAAVPTVAGALSFLVVVAARRRWRRGR
jgi:hypothetical protein